MLGSYFEGALSVLGDLDLWTLTAVTEEKGKFLEQTEGRDTGIKSPESISLRKLCKTRVLLVERMAT